jgi:hypothetical protein
MNMSNDAMVRNIIGSQTDDKTVLAQALMKVFQSAQSFDEKCELLIIALVERDDVPKVPKALPNIGIAEDLWDQLSKSHSDMINGHLKMAFFKSQTVKDFAKEIFRLIDFFESENEKTYCLAKALFSPYIPYRQLPGTPVHMTNAEFKQTIESERARIQLIEYIIELPFDEYSERASMLLQVLDDTTDKNVRVALLAAAWNLHEKKIVTIMKQSK